MVANLSQVQQLQTLFLLQVEAVEPGGPTTFTEVPEGLHKVSRESTTDLLEVLVGFGTD
jgi:hypothetical protein